MKKAIGYASIVAASFITPVIAGNEPTFTFGPASNYKKTVAPSATPTGSDLLILGDFSSGVPKSGLDIFVGPDLKDSVSTIIGTTCKNGLSADCANALGAALNTRHAGTIAARVVGLDDLLFAAATITVVWIAVGIQMLFDSTAKIEPALPVAIHLEPSDISQLQAFTTTTFVVSSPSATTPLTITLPPSETLSVPSATVTTLTADASSHHSGDVIIALPTEPAHLMKQLIDQFGGHEACKNTTSKRLASGSGGTINRQAIQDTFLIVIPMAAPGQLLDALGLGARQLLPHFRDAADQAALVAAQHAANLVDQFQGVSQDLINNVAQVVYMAVSQVCAMGVDDLVEIVAEEWQFEDPPQEDDKKCSYDPVKQPICPDASCNGNNRKCTTGDHNGCPCLPVTQASAYPANLTWLDWGQETLSEMLGTRAIGTPECDITTRMSFQDDDFHKLIDTFCQNRDLSKDFSQDVDASKAGVTGYPPYTFSFDWKHKTGTCADSCSDTFKSFTAAIPCNSYANNTIPTSATNDLSCGTASYSFTTGSKNSAGGSTLYVDQGNLNCGTNKNPGNANFYVDLDMMNNAAKFFCNTIANKIGQQSGTPNQVELNYNAHYGDPVYLSMAWSGDPTCPKLDIGSDDGKTTCVSRFSEVINGCDTNNDKGYHWWKQGGSFFRDCMTWTIRRDSWIYSGLGAQAGNDDSWRPWTKTCSSDDDCQGQTEQNACSGGAYSGVMCYKDSSHTELGWCKCKD